MSACDTPSSDPAMVRPSSEPKGSRETIDDEALTKLIKVLQSLTNERLSSTPINDSAEEEEVSEEYVPPSLTSFEIKSAMEKRSEDLRLLNLDPHEPLTEEAVNRAFRRSMSGSHPDRVRRVSGESEEEFLERQETQKVLSAEMGEAKERLVILIASGNAECVAEVVVLRRTRWKKAKALFKNAAKKMSCCFAPALEVEEEGALEEICRA